jgi:hypothetical protein
MLLADILLKNRISIYAIIIYLYTIFSNLTIYYSLLVLLLNYLAICYTSITILQ